MKTSFAFACALASAAVLSTTLTADARMGQERGATNVLQIMTAGQQFSVDPTFANELTNLKEALLGTLLSISDPCARSDLLDRLVTFGKTEVRSGNGGIIIQAAQRAMHAEQNFDPTKVQAAPACLDPAKPHSPELRGILPLVDPSLPNAAIFNQQTTQLLEQIITGQVDAATGTAGESVGVIMASLGFTAIQGNPSPLQVPAAAATGNPTTPVASANPGADVTGLGPVVPNVPQANPTLVANGANPTNLNQLSTDPFAANVPVQIPATPGPTGADVLGGNLVTPGGQGGVLQNKQNPLPTLLPPATTSTAGAAQTGTHGAQDVLHVQNLQDPLPTPQPTSPVALNSPVFRIGVTDVQNQQQQQQQQLSPQGHDPQVQNLQQVQGTQYTDPVYPTTTTTQATANPTDPAGPAAPGGTLPAQ